MRSPAAPQSLSLLRGIATLSRTARSWIAPLLAGIAVEWMTARCVAAAAAGFGGSRPNILFILTDDQGYGDLSLHGHPILQTPHLDQLGREAVRFTDFHVSPTCSPTRAALLTGRHEFRNGVTHTILERERLTRSAGTLAEVLESAGYATGIFGKWHLGDEPAYQPDRRGFHEVFIHGGGGIGQTYPGSCGDAPGNTYFDPVILHNGRFERTHGYCTDVFFAQAMHWIETRRRDRPFFAFITPNAPHAPLQVRPEDEARYSGRGLRPQAAKYLGMVANLDDNVGRLLHRLSELHLDQQTLVVFMSDNGADGGLLAGYNAGMRGGKGTAYLGGTRAISFWRWPGHFHPGECHELSAHVDVLPTLMELSGARWTDRIRRQIEGRSLLPLLEHPSSEVGDRFLFTHLGRWPRGADPETARYRTCGVRTRRWHLVSPNGDTRPLWQLFDIVADPGETRDVRADHPEIVADLALRYDRWWESLGAGWVNESAIGPRVNPFKARYWSQFGGGPSDDDLRAMDLQQNPATRPPFTPALPVNTR